MGKSTGDTNGKNRKKADKEIVQLFLVSLYFLSERAKQEKLPHLAELLQQNINNVGHWSGETKAEMHPEIIDNSLYEAINLLHQLLAAPSADRSDFLASVFALQNDPADNLEPQYN